MHLILSTTVLVYVVSTAGQTCLNPGKECFSHNDCCGGCCKRRTCVESTRNCLLDIDDCAMFHCPPGMSCSLFQMPGCPGCPITPYCKEEGHPIPGDWS